MKELGGLFCVLLGWLGPGAALLKFALASVRKEPGRAKGRAVPWALGVGLWSGLALGAGAFVWGASMPDESAGAIAVMLFTVAALAGGGLSTLAAWLLLWRKARPAQG